jgi:RNA polymerase sigma-70 factor (ECF subfamily)
MVDSNITSIKEMKDGDVMSGTDITSRFNEIYDSTNKFILAFITAKCSNMSDVGDIFQDTYMELYQRLDKKGADYIIDGKAFVFKIAKQKIARHYSLLKRLRMFVPIGAANGENEYEVIELSDMDVNSFLMEDFAVDQIMLDKIRQLIKQKSSDIEQIFYFFYDMGLSIPEIAQAMSLSESNVKNKLYRTVKELKNLLKGGNHNER